MNIKKGVWCPICSQGISERICRRYFEEIFEKKFPKKRPSWLKGINGKPLELDGYCEELELAFEYQGMQHYEPIFFNKKKSLEVQKESDKLKKTLCKKENVVLIEVPYTIEYSKMDKFIVKECKKNKIKIPKITRTLNHNLFKIYSPYKIKEMRDLAKSKEGKCLSKSYIKAHTKLKWQCKEGHKWMMAPTQVSIGQWCPYCRGRNRTIRDMQEIARLKRGECLSKRFHGMNKKLRWSCSKGHEWKAIPSSIKGQHWCPKCAHLSAGNYHKLDLKHLKDLAKSLGGKCLSKKYVNMHAKYMWRCDKGHIWKAKASHVKNKHWCPYCAGNKKLSISNMKKIAKSKGGKCLSKKYFTNRIKLKWECKNGHIWFTTPTIIKNHWCPKCAFNMKRPSSHKDS